MYSRADKKKLALIVINAFMILVVVATISVIVSINMLLGSALYSSPETRQKKADNYTIASESTPKGGTVFLGDSIIEMYDLDRHFPEKGYINRGISGDRTNDIISRLDGNVVSIVPSRIIIMIGINDMGHDVTIDEFINNYNTIIDSLRTALPETELFIQTLYPLRYEMSIMSNVAVNARTHTKVVEWNKHIASFAKEKTLTLIDMYPILSDGDGRLHKSYTREGLHISEKGYTKISAEFAKILG